jgi:hypothetical protein
MSKVVIEMTMSSDGFVEKIPRRTSGSRTQRIAEASILGNN